MSIESITLAEVRIIHQALNEVCNGVDFSDDEFVTRMGCSRQEALALMNKIQDY